MANEQSRSSAGDADKVQDLEVQRVSGSTGESIQSQGGDWRLSFRAVRIHNDHLSGRRRTSSACPVCKQGLAGVLAKVEEQPEPVVENEMAEGNGGDAKRYTTPSSGDGAPPDRVGDRWVWQ